MSTHLHERTDTIGPQAAQSSRRWLALVCISVAQLMVALDATVINIAVDQLPAPAAVVGWTSEQFTAALRHDWANPAYNPSLRQLLHVGFKIAAKMGRRYIDLLEANEAVIAKNVTENLYARHIAPVFFGQ